MVVIKSSICYIVGAYKSAGDNFSINKKENDYIIAADGGHDILSDMNIVPDLVIGDFDSAKAVPDHDNIIKHPVEKDDTDTFLAIKAAREMGYNNFVIYGGIGGRLDHTFANIQTLSYIAKEGGKAFLLGEETVVTAIHNSKIEFSSDMSGKISVFSGTNQAENVTIKGLKYCAENILLNCNFPLGVSNEFIGNRAEVSVENGTLIIIWNEKASDFIKKIHSFLN